MFEFTGICCSRSKAIEFMESLAEIIDEDIRTEEFCQEYEEALNRFRYELAKGEGTKIKTIKAVHKGHHDLQYCGKCGSGANEIGWKYCPNCGTRIIRNK